MFNRKACECLWPAIVFWAGLLRVLLVICGLVLAQSIGCHSTDMLAYDANPAPGRWTAVYRARTRRRRRRDPLDASASYSRYSSHLQEDTSIAQQQERMQGFAEKEGRSISAELEFADEAISGTKRYRDGLDALLAAAEAGRLNTVYFYSLSRLARESVIGMPILKRLVYVYHVRVISVTEGLDSNREGWETLAQILLMQHERYIRELGNNTFRGQQGNLDKGFSNGDYCFGYITVPAPGSDQTRRGRHAKPRMVYKVHPVEAEWVRRIFYWFVRERRSLRWITRELNRLGAPKDHRSRTKEWHHSYLPRLLANRKYIGLWPWGRMKNVRDPETGDISQEPRSEEETKDWERQFPELRIIDDETFAAAQRLLAENVARQARRHDRETGEFTQDQAGAAVDSPRHLLSGLIRCKVCGRYFNVGGANGKYLFCRGYQLGVCTCQTTLRRDLAEKLSLEAISSRILANANWVQVVFESLLTGWHRLQANLPNELRDTEAALADVTRKIGRLVDQVEEQDKPDPDVQERLAQRRAERRQLEDKLELLRCKATQTPQEPTLEWVKEELQHLHDVLASPTPAAVFALHDLVGGRIVVEEIREEGRKRFYLRGTFSIQLGRVLDVLGTGAEQQADSESILEETITIDFVDQDPMNAKAELAKALRDQGLPHQEIARKMGCWPSQVTKYFRHWEKMHGQPLPPRPRKADQQSLKHQQIADEVMRLVGEGLLLQEIAEQLGIGRDLVTKAFQWWHTSRGLAVPDGRARRKTLDRKSSKPRQPPRADEGGPPAAA